MKKRYILLCFLFFVALLGWTLRPRSAESALLSEEAPSAARAALLPEQPEIAETPTAEPVRAESHAADAREDLSRFHEELLTERARWGHELNDATRPAFRAWLREAEEAYREAVLARAEREGIPVEIREGEQLWILRGFENGAPVYWQTANVNAAQTTGANLLRLNADFDPPNASGEGMYVTVSDGGVMHEHTEFQLPNGGGSRIIYKGGSSTENHATHVAGTLGAWGYNSSRIGMAPRVWFRSLVTFANWHASNFGMAWPGEARADNNPRTGEPERQSVVGNVSLGGTDNRTRKGLYTFTSAGMDQILWDTPYYLQFFAAGNAGGNFSTLDLDYSVTKNAFTIGSINTITRDANGEYQSGGAIAGTSSRGPTYDGRIKPDFVARGVNVSSTTGTTGSSTMSGTSMATPGAAGSAVLLINTFHRKFPGHYPRASTVRALFAATADDLGPEGPDYTYGFGAINVFAAAGIVRDVANGTSGTLLLEERLHDAGTWELEVVSNGGPASLALSWIDPAGGGQMDNAAATRDPRLVNDLDVRLVGPLGGSEETHYPWVHPFTTGQNGTPAYDDSLRSLASVRGDNFTDNTELLQVDDLPAGTYRIEVTHKGSLHGGRQVFSLAASGLHPVEAPNPVVDVIAQVDGADIILLEVLGSNFPLGTDVRLRRPGLEVVAFGQEVTGSRLLVRVAQTDLSENGLYDVVLRLPDGREIVEPNAFLKGIPSGAAEDVVFWQTDFSSAAGWTLGDGWEIGVPNQGSVGGPGAAFAGDNVLGTWLNGNAQNTGKVYAELDPIAVSNRTGMKISFQRWLGITSAFSPYPIQYHTGSGWANVPGTYGWTTVNDGGWTHREYDLPAALEDRAFLRLRFELSEDANSYGWNIDDLRLTYERGIPLTPPTFTSSPVTEGEIGMAYNYSIAATDTNFGSLNLPAWLTLTDHGDGTATLSGTPNSPGSYPVAISVADANYVTWQTFEIAVSMDQLDPPSAPGSLTATALSHSEIELSWTDPPEQTDGFELQVSGSAEGPWDDLDTVASGPYTHSGLPGNSTRHYRVRAFNAAGAGPWSDIASATTQTPLFAEILRYEFTHAAEGVNPTSSAAGLVTGPAVNAGGLNRFKTDESPLVNSLSVVNNSTNTNVSQAFDDNEYFSITLEPEPGLTLSLQSLAFKVTRGGTAGTRNFAVRSSVNPAVNLLGPKQPTTARDGWDEEEIDLSGPEFQGLTGAVTFYFLVATDATSRSLEFDDIAFVGMLGGENGGGHPPPAGPVLYVNHAASGGNNGTSWGDAFSSLRDALAAAQAGQEMWVAAGSYSPFVNNRATDTFLLPSGVALYGGFAGTESERAERDWNAHETMLSGHIEGQTNVRHIVTATGAVDARIDGFTILAGHSEGENPYTDGVGAAVFVGQGEGRLTLANCRIVDNHAQEGGVVYFDANANDPSLRIENTVFAGNSIGSEWARGILQIRSNAAEVWLEACHFVNNPSGIFSEAGHLQVLRSQFLAQTNIAVEINYHGARNDFVNSVFDANGGGAIRMVNSQQLRVANCVFARNGNPAMVGGALNISQGRFEVYNSTFYGNSADEGAAIAWSYGWAGAATSRIHNAIFWDNTGDNVILLERYNTDDVMTLELRNNLLQGGAASVATWQDPVLVVENLIDSDPLFVDAGTPAGADGLWGTADDGLRLASNESPAFNAGLAALLPVDWLDVDGDEDVGEALPLDLLETVRVFGADPSLGAYEQPASSSAYYWGGGTANWTGTDFWFDNPELTGTGQTWQDGWDAVVLSGDPALNASVTVGDLHIETGARVRIGGGNQVLTVTGETTGTGTVRFGRTAGGNTSGLRFDNSTSQTVGWDFLLNNDQCRVRLEIAGTAPLTLDGSMEAWGNDFDIFQEPGSHLIIGPNARINNNRPDLINARPFQVWPADATAVFEMHADFDVDLADPDVLEDTYPFAKPEDDPGDGSYVKPVGGLSTWRTVSGTTITHATQNLASIHKYTGGTKRYTHHGLWNFEGSGSEPDPVWIVRTNPQSYDGGIYFVRDWTLNTEEDFTFEGLWHDGVNIGFSTRSGAQNITFTKTGPADFIIKGTQAYGPGSVMRVEEGGVRFYTDPMVGAVPKAGNGWFNNTGDFLNLEVQVGAEASFFPPVGETFHLASADIAGSLILHVHEVPALAVSGNLTVSGTLEIQPEIALSASSYVVATVDGTADLSQADVMVPQGWEFAVVGNELRLQQAEPDPFLAWLADNYPPGTTAESDDSRGGMTLTVWQVWLAGLTPNGTDVFRIYFDENGNVQYYPNLGEARVYTLLWTDDLTGELIWRDANIDSPPETGAVFFRVEVGLP